MAAMVEMVVAVVAEVGAMVVVAVMVGSELVVMATLGEHAVAGTSRAWARFQATSTRNRTILWSHGEIVGRSDLSPCSAPIKPTLTHTKKRGLMQAFGN